MTKLATTAGKILLGADRRYLLRDTFSRADNALTLGNAETGQAWSTFSGVYGISGNQAYCPNTGNGGTAYINVGAVNYSAEVTMVGTYIGANVWLPMLVVKAVGDLNHFEVFCQSNVVRIQSVLAGVYAVVSSAAHPLADGTPYRLTVKVIGTVITVYVDDVLKLTYTMTGPEAAALQANTNVGFRHYYNGSPATPDRWDNLLVTAE